MAGVPIAVIDVETTGLNPYRHDRIVEIAAVVIHPDGGVLRQFVSLVNPERDIGPTSIHGLTASQVHAAPRFGEIAAELIDCVEGCVAVAGHNVQFDLAFLVSEFGRIGHPLHEVKTLCTMRLAGGGTLLRCCSDYGVALPERAHSALDDARATADLLTVLLSDAPTALREVGSRSSIRWPNVPRYPVTPVTRIDVALRQDEPPAYIQRLLETTQQIVPRDTDDETVAAYTALLDQILEDRCVDESEAAALIEVAVRWGIGREQVLEIHDRYIEELVGVAKSDAVVTPSEQKDLVRVAELLGISKDVLATKLKSVAAARPPQTAPESESESLAGKRVCFTGECQCRYHDGPMTRAIAQRLAGERGLVVAESVTKKLDVLVVADPHTASGKAKKARQYGIRILHEPVFWQMLGIGVE